MKRRAPRKAAPPPVESDRIHHADCRAAMRAFPDACVDLVVTDPPFAINFRPRRTNYNRTQSRVLEGYNEVAPADYAAFTRDWMAQAHRLLKPSGSAFVFSGWNNLKEILTAADEIGFVTVNHIIWKYQFGVVTRRKFVTSHYHCLYLCKDERRRRFFPDARYDGGARAQGGGSLRYRDLEDVWQIPREYWHGDRKTPTKLPAALLEKILAYASEPGDLVLDPFLGSGQVAVVARRMGRRYLGFEIVKEYCEFARARLESGQYRIKHTGGAAAPAAAPPASASAPARSPSPRPTRRPRGARSRSR